MAAVWDLIPHWGFDLLKNMWGCPDIHISSFSPPAHRDLDHMKTNRTADIRIQEAKTKTKNILCKGWFWFSWQERKNLVGFFNHEWWMALSNLKILCFFCLFDRHDKICTIVCWPPISRIYILYFSSLYIFIYSSDKWADNVTICACVYIEFHWTNGVTLPV